MFHLMSHLHTLLLNSEPQLTVGFTFVLHILWAFDKHRLTCDHLYSVTEKSFLAFPFIRGSLVACTRPEAPLIHQMFLEVQFKPHTVDKT